MDEAYVLILAAVLGIGFAVIGGPLLIVVRAGLRLVLVPAKVRQWQKPVAFGLATGAIAATLASGLAFEAAAAMTVAVIGILILLAALDLAWRWLPFEWTIPLLGLGLVNAVLQGTLAEAMIGLLVGAGTLIALQLFFHFGRGLQALGTGDIWLAAGLGALSGMPDISYILPLAAVTGLLAAGVSKLGPFTPHRQRYGVAYGAHLCLAYVILLIL